MNETVSFLHEDLVFLNYEVKNRDELLIGLSEILIEKGYAKDSYTKGILDREEIFPTGLNTEGVKVAIPHTDAKHVNIPAIVIAKLKNPIVFKEMGSDTNEVEASLIFMLALQNPEHQLETLSRLMTIFSNGEILKSIYEAESASQVIEKLKLIIGE
ncbi:MAG: hypothetical protein K0R09_2886 [Clostridiales bacterium]|jgi:PTS system galactitol-specific IIA component|nr:hypothetical protein [Clostridiales bacterium]